MYNDLCLASEQTEMMAQERDKLIRDVDALVHDLAVKQRDSLAQGQEI